tara:strand:- start:232 stop:591 length:360 start_codon:yes stop_codon:yes gene_type:complete
MAYRRGVSQTLERVYLLLFEEGSDEVINEPLFFDIMRDEAYEMRYEEKDHSVFLDILFRRSLKRLEESGKNTIEAVEEEIEEIKEEIDRVMRKNTVQNARNAERLELMEERIKKIEKKK